MKKTCSLLITAYKSQDYILETIDSIKKQILPSDWKLKIYIGVDACPETAKVLQNAGISFYYSPVNVGTYVLTNTLIKKAKGSDMFVRFDSDDVMQELYLYEGINYTEQHGFFIARRIHCDENLVPEPVEKRNYPLSHGQIFVKGKLMEKFGGYHSYRVSCDSGLIFRAGELGYDISNFGSIKTHPTFLKRGMPSSLTRKEESAIGSVYRKSILNEMKHQIYTKKQYEIEYPIITDVHYLTPKSIIPTDNVLYVVCFKWGNKFSSHYVNALYRSLKKNLTRDHIFICYTDDVRGLDDKINIKPLWKNHIELGRNYRKLKLYDRKILKEYNYNVLVLDIDTIIMNNIDFLSDLNQNTIWKSPSVGSRGWVYNSSIVRVVNDEFCDMYDQFIANLKKAIESAKQWTGSDQAIISSYFHNRINTITESDGIISFRDQKHLFDQENIKMINFYHSDKCGTPMDVNLQNKYPWIKLHWHSYLTEDELNRKIPQKIDFLKGSKNSNIIDLKLARRERIKMLLEKRNRNRRIKDH